MGILEWIDRNHISESEFRDIISQLKSSRNPARLLEHVFNDTDNNWSYTDDYVVPAGRTWTIYEVTSAVSLTGTCMGLGNAIEIDIGSGYRFFGGLNLSSAAGGAPNRASSSRYSSGITPFTLYPGQRIRVMIAPDGLAGKYCIITYTEDELI